MKTAGRENLNHWTILSNRAPGAGGQNQSCSIQWAAKQEKFRPQEKCFFLTSPFIELLRPYPPGPQDNFRLADHPGVGPSMTISALVITYLRIASGLTTTPRSGHGKFEVPGYAWNLLAE
jgi:hypothetical protein